MHFPWTREEFSKKIQNAVDFFWKTRQGQGEKQKKGGRPDAGTRGNVTGGKHLDAFVDILFEIGREAGYDVSEIYDGKDFPIPGYYRPQKNWDVVFAKGRRLVAVVELKSQCGSFGNNCNNRTEEVIGVSHDFWRAYREKVLGVTKAPWIGYFFLLERSEQSTTPVKPAKGKIYLPQMTIFNQASYTRRYEILCERLMLERDYSAAALLSTSSDGVVSPVENDQLSFYSFCDSLYRHLVANA